jgi:cystathionine beta-lyase/cystathionine gamma-synthase
MSNAAHDGFATQAIHVGQAPDPQTGAVSVPIYQTSTYAQPVEGGKGPHFYGRASNPTRSALEEALAALDGGAHALAFASGLGAAPTEKNPRGSCGVLTPAEETRARRMEDSHLASARREQLVYYCENVECMV